MYTGVNLKKMSTISGSFMTLRKRVYLAKRSLLLLLISRAVEKKHFVGKKYKVGFIQI